MLDSTVQRKCKPATLGNICLKINAKLGGSNSIIDLGTRPPVIPGIAIVIFGADVTHPHSDDTTSPSIASVVVSIDLEGGKYQALHRNQKYRQEIIAGLTEMTKDHLRAFYRTTGAKPVKLIFYHDGVSDGQFAAVRLEEIAALKACSELQKDYQPKITFIVVQKRHHTRLFPKNREGASGKGENVPPGTMVDRTIPLSLISTCVHMLQYREQVARATTTCCGMTATSQLMSSNTFPTSCATCSGGATGVCPILHPPTMPTMMLPMPGYCSKLPPMLILGML